MARHPSVWKVRLPTGVSRQVLEDEVAQLRDVPYSVWREVINSPRHKTLTGRDGRIYLVKLGANWAASGSENIRVTVALRTRGWGLRLPLRQSFIITPDSRFVT